MITLGIDIGSRTAKAVLFCHDTKSIVDSCVRDTTSSPKNAADNIAEEILSKNGLLREDISYTVSTGYGRQQVEFADKKVTEILCHAKGINFLYPEAKTVIDIGGQDSKAISIERGHVSDFAMNDKCAAGTGRFLEVAAKIMEIPLENMKDYISDDIKPCSISSTCTVFAESEIISLLATHTKKQAILAGLLKAFSKRILSLAGKVGLNTPVVFTGGVAKNQAMVKFLEEEFDCKLLVPENPSITGALGAAILAKC